jgi:hypothetical protein
LRRVTGDNYAGQTFKLDFEAHGITYISCSEPKTTLYEELEPRLNAGEIELPDIPKLQEQLLGMVVRGTRVDHLPGEHDDFANAVAGAVWLLRKQESAGRTIVTTYTRGVAGPYDPPVKPKPHFPDDPNDPLAGYVTTAM